MVFDTARFLEIPGFSEAQELRESGRFLGSIWLVAKLATRGRET